MTLGSAIEVKAQLAARLQELLRVEKERKFERWFPDHGECQRLYYKKHMEVIRLSKTKPYILFQGANGTGKTELGAYMSTAHFTGLYPKWWDGYRFDRPIDGVIGGTSWEEIAKTSQYKLLGPDTERGTGMVPGRLIQTIGQKVPGTNAVRFIYIKHVSGGLSRCLFQSYEAGREGFQGTEREWHWLDEESENQGASIFAECVYRGRGKASDGRVLITFTPLFGLTDLVCSFTPGLSSDYNEKLYEQSGKAVVKCTTRDVPHITESERERRLANSEPHLRDARDLGEATSGIGKVYTIPMEMFEVDVSAFPNGMPPHWPRMYALDTGFGTTAALWGALDRDTDTIYLYSEHYVQASEPAMNAAAIKARGRWIPGVIDPQSRAREQTSNGKDLFSLYTASEEDGGHGLDLVNAIKHVDGGIHRIQERLATGRLKVLSNLVNWKREYSTYRRNKEGDIVKTNDHLMDCTRYLEASIKERGRTKEIPLRNIKTEKRFFV